MKTKRSNLYLGQDEWKNLIATQAAGGSSISAICRERQVNEKTFYNWRKKLDTSPEPKSERFIQIKTIDKGPEKILGIQTPSGYRLEILPGTEESYVQSILKILVGL